MTETDIPSLPRVLVDDPDGYPEETVWVEVVKDYTDHASGVLATLDSTFPQEDRPEEHGFDVGGEQVWLKPKDDDDAEGEDWKECDPTTKDEPTAKLFWVVKVVCRA